MTGKQIQGVFTGLLFVDTVMKSSSHCKRLLYWVNHLVGIERMVRHLATLNQRRRDGTGACGYETAMAFWQRMPHLKNTSSESISRPLNACRLTASPEPEKRSQRSHERLPYQSMGNADLAVVADAWPSLPEHIKLAILALVRDH